MSSGLHENTIVAGRYRLNRVIGRGGMGSVWHATDIALDVACAVKFIDPLLVHIPEATQRFEREAKAAAQIRSPHVVNILEHGMHDGVPFIAMELLEGEDLGKRITRVLKMPPHEVASILTQVCRALSRAHAQEIVHRDLKRDNIFLVRDDDREIAKVLDFGIAKRTSTGLDVAEATRTGAMLGTPSYMSPEQAQGVKTVDYRSDLWSVAVIAFRCITGVLPFRSEALGDLLLKLLVQPLPVPSRMTVDVPPGFDAWWERAAQRDPARRFQSAKELSDALVVALGVSQWVEPEDRASRSSEGEGRRAASSSPPSPAGRDGARAPGAEATGSPMARSYGRAEPVATKEGSSNGFSGFVLGLLAAAAVAAGVYVLRGRVTFEWDRPNSTVSVESAEPDAAPIGSVTPQAPPDAGTAHSKRRPPKPQPKPAPAIPEPLGTNDAGAD
jgi:serine/threonine-protein kinase